MDDDFWKPRENLKQQFHERLNEMSGTDLAKECIEAFFDLEGAKSWRPDKVALGEVAKVIDLGLVISILKQTNLQKDYQDQINESLKTKEDIPRDLWSELLVATLMKHMEASVQFVPRGASKTADLSCNWDGQPCFDVEVTRGKMKAWHQAVQQGLNDFVDALAPGDVDWHIACFVSDASDKEILTKCFAAAARLKPGERAEQEGLWSVTAIPLADRDSIVGGQSSGLYAPTWWPQQEAGFFINGSLLNGKGNPVVALRSLVPLTSYMNPIKRKAEHGQHTGGRPYVIALDASELPRATTRLPADIELDFPIWTHVSGVLIFSPLFYITSRTKEFKFRLLANPHAEWPMTKELLELSLATSHEVKFEICV
ncbi:hypothetical protein [Duganella radicis]|uniref:Uncharacterized protein n=1 Tax=Duganella radicis TaxID=551988 RepID=A0A6L6PLK2_9BURK|nr:hypothetical protein [Duganella radicis]MTV39511.1 hypothetical protein [Duganella radicis]